MNLLRIMASVPSPDMRRSQHRGCSIIAETLIQMGFAVVLSVRGAPGVRPEVGRVPGDVVTILVIKDTCIVRGIRPIAAARCLHQRSVLEQLPPWTEMDLPIG